MAEQITRDEFTDFMEAFEQRLMARFARADRRLDGIEGRLDEFDGRFDGIEIERAFAGDRHRAGDRATQDQADMPPAYTCAFEHVDRLNARLERCTRLVGDLEDRLNLARATDLALPEEFFVTQDTRDERTALSDAGTDAPADPLVNHANGTTVEPPVTAKGRKGTRRATKSSAPAPPVQSRPSRRQRRSKT